MSLSPPMGFAMVSPGVYRSGFPTRHNLEFLSRLGLRSIVKVESVEHRPDMLAWLAERQIQLTECSMVRSVEPFVSAANDPAEICKALRVLIDPAQQPVLIHSLKGEGRVGVVIGLLRRLQHWSLASIFDEYRRFAGASASLLDIQCIELFDLRMIHAPPAPAPAPVPDAEPLEVEPQPPAQETARGHDR